VMRDEGVGDGMVKRYHVYFSGQVQGVGFRFIASRLAGHYDVSGWVRNLGDGRVELDVQAEKADLDDFLAGLQKQFSVHLRDIDKQELPLGEAKGEFEIRP
jgi:acylphosphatase